MGTEEKESTGKMFQEDSDNKLMVAIESYKRTLVFSAKLADGSKKLRRRVMLMETERERRRHLKMKSTLCPFSIDKDYFAKVIYKISQIMQLSKSEATPSVARVTKSQ
ncbi:hypothetical protein LIER_14347 [Lithospermum erythrorhizon]|uniref:Uncharacterized protein n=1 Tax=Lithospermum erythrorhizon TaxID=34254 RepID=A0AAV3Q0T6_LITER